MLGLAGVVAALSSACDATSADPSASGASASGAGGAPAMPMGSATSTPTGSTPPPGAPTSGTTAASPASATDWNGLRTQLEASAALFAGASAGGLKGTTPAIRSWAAAAATMCAQQAARLGLADPLSGVTVRPAAPRPARFATMADATRRLASQQQALSARCAQLAAGATSGDQALLLVALAAAAHATATPGPAVTASTLPPAHADVGSRTDALQVLLSHLEATIEGYERGAGRLAVANTKALTDARTRIEQVQAMRDATQSALVRAGATPAPPPLGYAMPGGFTSLAAIHQAWGHLELSLADAWARVAAASSGRDRSSAISQVLAQVDAARALGVAPSTWPGWSRS